jgi:hypothetical protein
MALDFSKYGTPVEDQDEQLDFSKFGTLVEDARRELSPGSTPSTAGAGRGSVNPPSVKAQEDKGIIQRVGEFFRPEYKSVLEGVKPTPQEEQAEIDRRLSYGAGPISRETAAKADFSRSGMLVTDDKTVNKVAAAMKEKGQPSFADLIERANDPSVVRAAREAKADEFRTAGEWAVDTLSGLAQGGTSLVQLPTNIIAPGSALAKSLRETQKELQAQESGVLQAQRERLRERVENEDGFLGKYFATIESLVTNPALSLSEATKQVPNFLGVMGLAKVGGVLAGETVGLATRASPTLALSEAIGGNALQTGARMAGTTAGGLTATTIMTSGDAAGNVYETLIDPKKTPRSLWEQNPDYQKLIAAGKSPAEAIDEIATAKARLAALIVAPLGVFGYMGAEATIASRGAGKILSEVATPKGAAKVFGKELIGEQVEEGGTQFGGNVITQTVNPQQKLMEGVPEAMATAAVTSAPYSAVAVGQQVRDQLNRPAPVVDQQVDALVRRAMDVQSYDANIISPTQTARINRAQSILDQATNVDDMTGAANELAGNLNEMLVPNSAVTPLPVITNEPILTSELPPLAPGRIEPTLTNEPITLTPGPAVNIETEQQFGLDKLRMNAPRPQSIQGKPAASLTDDDLSATIADPNVSAITRRSAEVELKARQSEQAPNAPEATRTATEAIPDVTGTLGSTPVRGGASAPVSELPGADAARANAQRSIDRWSASQGVASPIQFNPAPPEETAAVTQIGEALGSQFGTRLVAYHDTNPDAPNGVAVGGTAFVNTSNAAINIGRTSLHEFKHTIEQIAAAETRAGLTNTSAQQFTTQIDSIFDDMTDEGKRAYVENFLHKDELAGITDPAAREARVQELIAAPMTRSEMTADFLGNRATDKQFWASVAEADPQGFKGFVDKWLGIIDGLLTKLRGTAKQGKYESARVDKYVQDLNRAKMVARDALVAYRKGTLQQFAPQGEISGPSGNQNVPGIATSARPELGEAGGGEAPSYGTARQGAVSVVGRHYSTAPRESLSGAYYGRGLKGAERDRLDSSPDPRLKNRIYFYVDQGAGVRPESGVGGYAHEVKLDNIYDPQTRLIRPQADLNGFESAVINAGFDGYIAPFGNNQSAVVLLGQKHKAVPVKQIGQPASAPLPQAAAPTTLKKGLLSREANAIDVSKIPGAKMRMGSLEIPAEQTEAANAELERIGSDVRFAKKQQAEVAGPPVPKDFGVYKDVAKSFKLSDAEYNASALPLMTGQAGDRAFQTPRIGDLPLTVAWLDNRRQESGMPLLNIKNADDRDTLAKLLAAEAVAAIKSAGNAVEWYDETVAKTLRIMGLKYPELNSDPAARNAFLIAVAISSQTMNVEDNLRYASKQYDAFRNTGKFPEVGTGKSAPAMGNNFALANDVLAELGPDLLLRFLRTEFTKRDLETMGFPITGESMDENMLGSAIFGPKIGFGFYSNLTGNFEPVTMDMWFMRTIGRLAGTLPAFDEKLFPKQVAKLRAALQQTGDADKGLYAASFDPALVAEAMKTDEGAVALARQVNSLHNRQFIKERDKFDAGTRVKTDLVGAAASILKSADKPKDSPGSGGERQLLRDVVRRMVDKVEKETGKRVPPAALQALIWYPEQELYKKLGVKLRVTSQDYAGAAKSLLTKEGFDGKRISAAAKSGPGPARQVAGKQVAGTNQPTGQQGGPSGPLSGKEREAFIATRTPLETIFSGLGKRGLAKTRAEAAVELRPDGAQIKYVQENFLDILSELEDSDLVKINCD